MDVAPVASGEIVHMDGALCRSAQDALHQVGVYAR